MLPLPVVDARGRLLDRDPPSSAVVPGALVENRCSGSEEEEEEAAATETENAGEAAAEIGRDDVVEPAEFVELAAEFVELAELDEFVELAVADENTVGENNTRSEGPAAVVSEDPPGEVVRRTAERRAEPSGECAAAGRSGEGG